MDAVYRAMRYCQILGYREHFWGPRWDGIPEVETVRDRLLGILREPGRDLQRGLEEVLAEASERDMPQEMVGYLVRTLVQRLPVFRLSQTKGGGIRIRTIVGDCSPGVVRFYERCGFQSVFQSKDEEAEHLVLKTWP
jgi:hypothetical protein